MQLRSKFRVVLCCWATLLLGMFNSIARADNLCPKWHSDDCGYLNAGHSDSCDLNVDWSMIPLHPDGYGYIQGWVYGADQNVCISTFNERSKWGDPRTYCVGDQLYVEIHNVVDFDYNAENLASGLFDEVEFTSESIGGGLELVGSGPCGATYEVTKPGGGAVKVTLSDTSCQGGEPDTDVEVTFEYMSKVGEADLTVDTLMAGEEGGGSVIFECPPPDRPEFDKNIFTLSDSNEEGTRIINGGRDKTNRSRYWFRVRAGTNNGDAAVEVTATHPQSGLTIKNRTKIDCIAPPQDGGGKEDETDGGCCGKGDNERGRGSGRAKLGSVDVSIDMGTVPGGDSAGEIRIISEKGGYDLGKRFSAHYFNNIEGVESYHDTFGLRQVKTPGVLADLVTIHRNDSAVGDIYEIRFYDEQDFGDPIENTSLLAEPNENAEPFIRWVIQNPNVSGDPSFGTLYVSKHERVAADTYELRSEYIYEYSETSADEGEWILTTNDGNGNTLRTESLAKVQNTTNHTDTETYVLTEGTSTVKTVVDTYGYNNTQTVRRLMTHSVDLGNGQAPLERTYTYHPYSSISQDSEQLAIITEIDGSWKAFKYGIVVDGELYDIVLYGIGDKAAPANVSSINTFIKASGVHTVYTSYVPRDDNNTANNDESVGRPTLVREYNGDVEVSRTTYAYTFNGSLMTTTTTRYNGTETFTSVTVKDLDHENRLVSSRSADGTATEYLYDEGTFNGSTATPTYTTSTGGTFERTVVSQGYYNSDTDSVIYVNGKSTQSVTVYDAAGNAVLDEVYVAQNGGFASGARISWTVRQFDTMGRETHVYSSQGTLKETNWDETACCGTRTVTDESGVVTDFVYDSLGRLTSQTRNGVSGATAPLNEDVITTYDISYSAGLRIKTATVSSSDASITPLVTSKSYDSIGRLVSETDAAGLVTSYAYSASTADGKVVTKTLPGGSTEITEHYLDGRVKSISGTAVVPKAYLYGVNGDGSQWTKVLEGTSDINAATSWARWNKNTVDRLGRTLSSERPDPNGGVLTTTYFYNDLGQLEYMINPGSAVTRYTYDILGNQVASGLDLDGSGELESAGTDRMSESDSLFILRNSEWWRENFSTSYVTDGKNTDKIISRQFSRATGFTYSSSGAVTGQSESVVEYYNDGVLVGSETSSSLTAINRDSLQVTRISSSPGASLPTSSVALNGLPQSSTSAAGVTIQYGYDGLGRRVTVTDGRGNTSITTYQTDGRVDWVENGNGDRTDYTYDSTTGRLASVGQERDDGGFNYTYYKHNDRGQVEKVWGDVPQPTWTEYDLYGQREFLHTYREDFDASSATWPEGDKTQWVYHNATGVLEQKIDAAGGSVDYAYYNDGKLHERTWARTDAGGGALKTTYAYDPNTGAMASVDYSDTTFTPDVSFTYRRTGEIAGVTNADPLATSHAFDFTQWPAQVTENITGLYEASIVRSYDVAAGRRPVGVDVGADYDLDYHYDPDTEELQRVTGPGLPAYGAEYSYMTGVGGVRQSNLVTGIAFKSDASTVIAEVETKYEDHRNLLDYIENRWVAGGTPSVVSKYDVTNDVLGRRSNTAYSGAAFATSFNQSYGHNARNELINSLRSDVGSWDYDYDNIGNRLTSSANGNSVSYVSNRLNQYLRKGSGGGLRYDADGNLTSVGSAADLDDDGDVDVNDFVVFEQQITGPTSVPAAVPMAMGMEQMAVPMAMMAAPQADAAASEPAVAPWSEEESTAVLKVKALSGGPALTTLEPNTTYQLRYRAGVNQVNGFMVSVFADSAGQGINSATAPTGDWGGADVFEFIDLASTSAGAVYDADGRAMRQMVHSFWYPDGENTGSADESAGRRGQLFQFTTRSTGTIHFELFMDWIDVESREGVWMRTDLTVEVVDPASAAVTTPPAGTSVVDAKPAKSTGFNGQLGSALAALLMATGGTGGPEFALADLDGDGDSDLADFAMFQKAFGDTGGTRYTWNTENRLTGVEPMAPKNGDKKLQFAYDHMGKRVLKRVWTYSAGSWGTPTAETKYVYDGWRVIMELDGLNNDAVTRKYTWGLDLSGSLEGAGGIGGLLATEDTAGTTATASDDRTFIYFYEPNGNVGQLVETTTGTNYGTLAAKYEYDPYGKRINSATPGEYDQPYRFSTKPVDDETGLGYWGYRYYLYSLGRWVNRDPIGERGGLNLYGYVNNFPNKEFDSLGLTNVGYVTPWDGKIDLPPKPKPSRPTTPYVIEGYHDSTGITHCGMAVTFPNGMILNLDFGPVRLLPFSVGDRGQSPFWGTPPARGAKGITHRKLKIRSSGNISAGKHKGTKCECATPKQVVSCLRYVSSDWNGSNYNAFFRNCRSFVKNAQQQCCLDRVNVCTGP